MKLMPILTHSALVIALAACGGGGGGSTSPVGTPGGNATPPATPTPGTPNTPVPTTPDPTTPPVVNPDLPEPTVESSAELQVEREFAFATSYELMVDVDVSATTTDRAYLSICSDYTRNDDDSYTINYENCLLRTPLTNGVYNGDLVVTNDKTELVSAIWFYNQGADPVINVWQRGNQQTPTLLVRLVP